MNGVCMCVILFRQLTTDGLWVLIEVNYQYYEVCKIFHQPSGDVWDIMT